MCMNFFRLVNALEIKLYTYINNDEINNKDVKISSPEIKNPAVNKKQIIDNKNIKNWISSGK